MSQYFYFVASLPLLLFHEPARITLDGFLKAAERSIEKGDITRIRAARLDNFDTEKKIHPLFSRFQEWEINLRNRLASLRAAVRKIEGGSFQRRARPVVETTRPARQAFEAAHPLLGEEVLLRARWDFLQGLEAGRHFDLGFLIVYALKLQLLERKARLVEARGAAAHAALEADLDRELAERMKV